MAAPATELDFHPRRGKARLRVGIPATLVTVLGRQDISLVDLSETGARVHLGRADRIDAGLLRWLGFEAFGSVVWRKGPVLGLRFEKPIAPDWVLDTRQWLPALPRGTQELRRFARDWVTGAPPQAERAKVSAIPLAGRAGENAAKSRGMRDWLRVGWPFVVAGLVLGVIAGYWSVFR